MAENIRPTEADVKNNKVKKGSAGQLGKKQEDAPERITRFHLIIRRFMRNRLAVFGVIGITFIAIIAIFAPLVSPWTYLDQDLTSPLEAPSANHWFGTNQIGLDMFAMTFEGLRKSMIIGVSVAFIQTTLAAIIGSTAAYFGGWTDKVILWCVDLLLVIPSFLLIAVITRNINGQDGSILPLIILLAAFGWMITSRVIRSMTLSVKNLDYVRAARYMSVPSVSIIAKHIIPNVSSYLIIDFTLGMSSAVLAETTLSYFGFGVKPPNTSLGTLIAAGQDAATTFPWLFVFPALMLTSMLICVNFIGDGLRDAIDPSSKSGGKA